MCIIVEPNDIKLKILKTRISIKTLLFLIFLFASNSICKNFAQDIVFHHLTTDEGLSQTSVVALYQDEIGFVWAGTREGLNRYDGNSITTYKLRKNDPNSLFCNNILKITGDEQGKIFLLTTEGLCEYDTKYDRFKTLWKDPDITTLFYYNNKLYVGKGAKVYVFDHEYKISTHYELPISKSKISSLIIDTHGILYIGTTNNGLYKLSLKHELSQPIKHNNIASIFEDSTGKIWVGSWDNGLYMLSGDKITNYTNESGNIKSISSNFVRCCAEDNQGNIWIGTFKGLDKYDKTTCEFIRYNSNDEPNGLTHSSIWSIIKDHQGTIWLGTFFGGINFFNPDYEIYTRYTTSEKESQGLSSPIVGRIIEDKDKNLWICTEGGGVNRYNRKTKTFKWYLPIQGKNSISQNNVKAIHYDREKDIMWFGLHLGGLNKLDLKTDRFTHYRYNPNNRNSIASDIVRDIEPYGTKLILATDGGVCIFDPESGLSESLAMDKKSSDLVKNVFDVYIDHQGTLWISVIGEGVFTYNFKTKKLNNYRHNPNKTHTLSNNNVNSIIQDRAKNLYFSTSGRGIDMYRYSSDDFENFDYQNNGLASDCAYNIYESNDEKLLVITNLGFSTFDLTTKRFHNYGRKNGFPLSTVNENALYQTEDGEIFLGGVKGMVSFHEQALNFTPKPYNIIFSRLFVNSKLVEVGDQTEILKKAFNQTSSIILKSNHSIFSIEFATTNYIAANANEIEYRLEGFSDEWNTARDLNTITYTNLNSGTYKLVLRIDDGENADVKEAILNITVLPPFYKTKLAYLIYILIALTILFFIIRSYKAHVRLETSLIYEQKHLQDTEELNQSKLRFFTNISHEFRTPLTLIIGQLESLLKLQPLSSSTYNKVQGVYNTSIQLKELISELLDFRKQEQGHMKINISENDIVSFLKNICTNFEGYATIKNIDLKFNQEADSLLVWYDTKQMQKVINNLLSNAFKYTSAGDSVVLNVKEEDAQAIIEVTDSGVGIDKQDVGRIFENFYQGGDIGSLSSGTGIGLALSKSIVDLHGGDISVHSLKDEGTTFIIKLKLGKSHFDPSHVESLDIQANISQEIDFPVLNDVLPKDDDEVFAPIIKGDVKMLIVEDNLALTEMLVEIFEPFYQIITASDGEEGLEKVKGEAPDIILSDVVMPKMSGIELCKAIKSDIETSHIPIVLLTAKAAVEHNLEGLRYGADDYIAKPFNVSLLIQRCNNLINSRILLKEKFSKQPQVTPQMLATNTLDKVFLDKVSAIIDQNMENSEFLVDDLASEMGMSRSKLFTKLKGVTGQTPNNFLMILRLKKAALLLRNNPELNVSDISVIVGFSSSRYFSKCFKDEYHIAPLAYRNEGVETGEEDAES